KTRIRNFLFLCSRYIMIYIILRSSIMKTGSLRLTVCTRHYLEQIIQAWLKCCRKRREKYYRVRQIKYDGSRGKASGLYVIKVQRGILKTEPYKIKFFCHQA